MKLVGIDPANPGRGLPRIQGVVVLFAGPGLTPTAVLDAAAVTALRTAAVSGLATRHLARPDSERLVLIGAGPQAHAHLDAMVAVRTSEGDRTLFDSVGLAYEDLIVAEAVLRAG